MAEDKDAKTEEPTAKRMGKAWSEGNIPMSQEVKSVSMLIGALIVVGVLAPWVARDLSGYMRTFLEHPEAMELDIESFQTWVIGNISPISGFKRLFSLNSLAEAGKGILKIIVVGGMIAFIVVPTMNHPDKLIGQDLPATLHELHRLIVMILFLVVMVMVALAAADYAFQRWSHKEKLKMTKQEVKDEHKEQEGDPKVKGRIRSLRLERHRQRMMANIPKASVIITNPTHFAVALQYDIDAMGAPKVVAKGVDYLAKRIRQIAETHEIPIVENPPLARALYAAVEVDQEIPQEHYKAVAEVIGYVMRLKGKRIVH
jgi:flagellar biosynthetic protein FlhB